jgi:hypothetical protein
MRDNKVLYKYRFVSVVIIWGGNAAHLELPVEVLAAVSATPSVPNAVHLELPLPQNI